MPKHEREVVDRGVVIRKHHGSWWLDAHVAGRRVRRNLGTCDVRRARLIARELAADIVGGRWNVAAERTRARTVAVETLR